jgi:hypothetical protein
MLRARIRMAQDHSYDDRWMYCHSVQSAKVEDYIDWIMRFRLKCPVRFSWIMLAGLCCIVAMVWLRLGFFYELFSADGLLRWPFSFLLTDASMLARRFGRPVGNGTCWANLSLAYLVHLFWCDFPATRWFASGSPVNTVIYCKSSKEYTQRLSEELGGCRRFL